MDPAEKAFRVLRENWFNSHLRSYPHERDSEDESRAKQRYHDNVRAKVLFDMDTEAILRGEDRPITPECFADIALCEDLVVAARDQVVQRADGSKYVARKAHILPEGAMIVADSPHEDGDMSYCCGQDWCGCMQ